MNQNENFHRKKDGSKIYEWVVELGVRVPGR